MVGSKEIPPYRLGVLIKMFYEGQSNLELPRQGMENKEATVK